MHRSQSTPSSRLALSIALCLAASGCARPQPELRPRNVILISIDTLRADHLGCYGYERPTSPNLDALASQGVLFESTSSTAPWTIPAHLSMLTGLYPRSHGVDDSTAVLPSGIETLPERLAAGGFRTGAFVNAELMKAERGFGRGFETFVFTPSARRTKGATPKMVDDLRAWIAQDERPFFAFLHLYDVHSDYSPEREYREQFARPYEGKANGSTRQLRLFRLGRLEDWGAPEAEHLVDLYDAGIRQMDAQLQELFTWLDSEGPGSETLVVVTSDHGEEFLEHGSVLHGRALYQELVHVPLILRGPGLPAGLRVEGDTSLVDLAPTLLALLGLSPLPAAEGRDLRPAWRPDSTWTPERIVFSEADFWMEMEDGQRRRSARKGRYKLLEDLPSGRRELYDLESDPGELVDLSAEQRTLLDVLARELENFDAGSRELEAGLELSEEERAELQRLGYY